MTDAEPRAGDLSPPSRRLVVDGLVTDPDDWDMPTISRELNIPKGTVNSWRNNTKLKGGADRTALPLSRPTVGQSPRWYAGTIRPRPFRETK